MDALVALFCLELYLSVTWYGAQALPGPEAGLWEWSALFLVLASMVGVVLRWRFPRTAFTAVLVASFTVAVGGGVEPPIIAGWAFYPLALTSAQGLSGLGPLRSRRPVLGTVAVVLVAVVAVVASASILALIPGVWPWEAPTVLWATGTGAMAIGGSWVVGRVVRTLHLQREHTARTEAAEVRTRERLRVAREVHDVVSHTLGTIGMRAGVARYVYRDDPRALRDALVEIETTSRKATNELRLLLDTLRVEGEAPLAPQPRLADLSGLADTARAAGLECTVSTHGVDTLPEAVAVSVFRLVQESVTNAIRHAPGTTCTITVTGAPDAVEIEVADTGPATGATHPPSPGSGTGQLGMSERVDLLGGTFTAGPVHGGGYRVHARIPLDPRTPTGAPAVGTSTSDDADVRTSFETSTDTMEESP